MDKVAKIKVKKSLKGAVLEAVDLIGGLKKFISKGDSVLLKPNFNTADPYPASTDLEFLKVVVELVYDCGAKKVIIGDSSTRSLKTREVMEKIGVFDLEDMKPSPKVYAFDEHKWIERKIPSARYLKKVSVTEHLDRADKLILLPCLKTHFLAQFTGSLKLSVGFMKPSERNSLHLGNLQEKIAELNKLISPHLIIMDARKCFINGGPSDGEIREPELILASKDRVAIDIEGIRIIQSFDGNSLSDVDPLELPQIKGTMDVKGRGLTN